VSFPLTQKW